MDTSLAKTLVLVGASLLMYAFFVSPPDPVAMGMLLFLTAPPAWLLTAFGRRQGTRRPLSTPEQGLALGAGFAMMWAAPWVAQHRLQMHLDSGADGAPGGLVMALPILGPLLWSLVLGWVMVSREKKGD